ncbi:hypothetical protein AB0K60_13365 [Thermopolyspora sp. NPDC052614]|uniref:hypothetical protein n=1 Tax=Thermopolyspora sp. NPDC052614 TaxID=3155682 RepID=UPI00341B0160
MTEVSKATPDPAAYVAGRFERGGIVAALVIAVSWHVGYDLTAMIANWSVYRWPAAVAAAWLAYVVIGAAGAYALLRTRRTLPGVWGFAAAAPALDVIVVAACPPGEVLGPGDWPWGAIGWLGVLLFWWRRGPHELIVFLALNGAVMLTGMALNGVLDRISFARFLMVLVGSVTLQLGYSVAAHAGASAARRAAELSAARAKADAARQVAEEVHADRLNRYAQVRKAAAELLTALADGGDPADPALRRACATGAARLRRLIAETDDVPDPLVHALRACAYDAERRGVVVSLLPRGTVPDLPLDVRRALTEAPLEALSRARSEARVTIFGGDGEVAVSVVADADDFPVRRIEGVRITEHREGDVLWIESRWPDR